MDMEKDNREETLEELFGRLDRIIAKLEDRDTTLEDSFAAYEQGVRYLKACNDKIDKIEKKMLVINESGGLDEF
ncbi:exodeoxyribonuclease VII small subunit [Oscillospiraceae bacterium Marseille-Q3528]|nr:exodeoxyribonuclease VII small subunit [Oscillospiraceae bacterium Marseille-Q3528]WNV59210.1 exodeoxyribonuclease VII small subunit [Oscillospiraceae bacterium NTUH-002-81]